MPKQIPQQSWTAALSTTSTDTQYLLLGPFDKNTILKALHTLVNTNLNIQTVQLAPAIVTSDAKTAANLQSGSPLIQRSTDSLEKVPSIKSSIRDEAPLHSTIFANHTFADGEFILIAYQHGTAASTGYVSASAELDTP